MKLNTIDFNEVQLDLDTGTPTNFNTCFHAAEEAPGIAIPTEAPYSFDKWLSLILRTRHFPSTAAQTVALTRAQVRVLVDAAAASIQSRVLNRAYAEDLQDEVHPALKSLTIPREGLFMRLAACSPKDGAHSIPGQVSLYSINDIILRLTTSARATSAFNKILDGDAQEAQLFFLPFDSRMRSEREYRVFCAPDSLRIAAVSQYRWHRPWMFADKTPQEMGATARQILGGVEQLHAEIMAVIQENDRDHQNSVVRTQGLTFDVLYDEETERCDLIELNTFGARSGCGSCLFQWIKDRNVLYGISFEDVEFRVAM